MYEEYFFKFCGYFDSFSCVCILIAYISFRWLKQAAILVFSNLYLDFGWSNGKDTYFYCNPDECTIKSLSCEQFTVVSVLLNVQKFSFKTIKVHFCGILKKPEL